MEQFMQYAAQLKPTQRNARKLTADKALLEAIAMKELEAEGKLKERQK
jgi:hypothetical protein